MGRAKPLEAAGPQRSNDGDITPGGGNRREGQVLIDQAFDEIAAATRAHFRRSILALEAPVSRCNCERSSTNKKNRRAIS